MELKGKLGTFPLTDVLHFIEEKGHTGYLGLHLAFEENSYPSRLLGPTLDERLIIEKGRLHGLASLRSPHIWCRLLVRGELIPRAKEKELRQRLEWVGDALLQTLTGILDVEGGILRERMELFLRERAAWLFLAQDGDFWFEFEQPPSMPPGWEAVPLGELIRQGPEYARMLEALFSNCPDPMAIVQVASLGDDDPPPEVLPPGEWETLTRVSGFRTVEDLLRDSRLPVYEAANHILQLQNQGYIRLVSPKEATEDPSAETATGKGSRIGRLRGMLQIGRGTEEIPEDLVGKACFLANRLIDQAGSLIEDPCQAWAEVLHTHPLASVLTPTEEGFDPTQFEATVAAWGSHAEDWKEVETETREALLLLLSHFFHDLARQEGRKRAESTFRRAWQDLPTDVLGTPNIEDLEAMLPAA